MKRKAWLLLVVVPVLLAGYALKRSLIPASAGGGEATVDQRPHNAPKSSPEPGTVAVSGTMPQEPTMVPTLPKNMDPFAVLDQQYEALRMAETARFDEAEARIRARVQPALDASVAKHNRDVEDLDGMNLTVDQKIQWNMQLNLEHEKAELGIKRTIQPDLDELAVQRGKALEKLESDRAEKRARLEELQAKADEGLLDPGAAKRAQFEILGIILPPSAFGSLEDREAQTGPETTPPKQKIPTVQAIVATADNRFCALIGDALVSEGDTVQGYYVRKINPDSVVFEKDGETRVRKAD